MLTLTIQSTHFYLVGCTGGWLLVDAGRAGSLPRLKAELKGLDVAPSTIRFVMATHYHPDHGGLVQEVKRGLGARLIIHERQLPGLEELKAFYARKSGGLYVPAAVEQSDLLLKSAPDDNHAVLQPLGIQGAIVETPGHSDDSVSLVLDSGEAFTGDLHLPGYATPENFEITCESWRRLVHRGAHWVYPAHGIPFDQHEIMTQLENSCR